MPQPDVLPGADNVLNAGSVTGPTPGASGG